MRLLPRRAQLALTASTVERRITWMLGSSRSGTTWLALLLAHASGAVVVDEPLIGVHLAVPMATVTSVPDPAHLMVHEASASRPAYFFSDESAWAWRPRLRSMLLARFAAAALESGAPQRGPIVIKEPNGALAAPVLLQTLPRSRLLFVMRDGRDVVDSMTDGVSINGWISEAHGATLSPEERGPFLERRAHHWVRTVEAVSGAYDAHPAPLRLRVAYEDLVARPAQELERILHWLGCPSEPSAVAAAVEALSFENLPAAIKGPGRFAREATPGLWRERFTPEEKEVLADVMAPTLSELGYEPF